MKYEEIIGYLKDNTKLPDKTIKLIIPEIESKLDYSPMYQQIDELVRQITTDD